MAVPLHSRYYLTTTNNKQQQQQQYNNKLILRKKKAAHLESLISIKTTEAYGNSDVGGTHDK
jgi:hypothetical protein